jgi:hypothetical protein
MLFCLKLALPHIFVSIALIKIYFFMFIYKYIF